MVMAVMMEGRRVKARRPPLVVAVCVGMRWLHGTTGAIVAGEWVII